MKRNRIITLLALAFLSSVLLAFAAIEIQIGAVSCPSKIKIGTSTGIIELDFEEYLKGVVPYEMNRLFPSEALKAQAVAARTFAIKNLQKHEGKGFNLCDDPSHCQVWFPPEDSHDDIPNGYPTTTNKAVSDTAGIGATYNGVIDATYFSGTTNHYTKNSEDINNGGYQWNYSAYLRKTITPETSGTASHGGGLSQYGAKSLADSGIGYEDILKHYYGPVPPYVKKVMIYQDGTTEGSGLHNS